MDTNIVLCSSSHYNSKRENELFRFFAIQLATQTTLYCDIWHVCMLDIVEFRWLNKIWSDFLSIDKFLPNFTISTTQSRFHKNCLKRLRRCNGLWIGRTIKGTVQKWIALITTMKSCTLNLSIYEPYIKAFLLYCPP